MLKERDDVGYCLYLHLVVAEVTVKTVKRKDYLILILLKLLLRVFSYDLSKIQVESSSTLYSIR